MLKLLLFASLAIGCMCAPPPPPPFEEGFDRDYTEAGGRVVCSKFEALSHGLKFIFAAKPEGDYGLTFTPVPVHKPEDNEVPSFNCDDETFDLHSFVLEFPDKAVKNENDRNDAGDEEENDRDDDGIYRVLIKLKAKPPSSQELTIVSLVFTPPEESQSEINAVYATSLNMRLVNRLKSDKRYFGREGVLTFKWVEELLSKEPKFTYNEGNNPNDMYSVGLPVLVKAEVLEGLNEVRKDMIEPPIPHGALLTGE